MLLCLLVFVHRVWFDAFHNQPPLVLSDASMPRKRQENVKRSVKNRKVQMVQCFYSKGQRIFTEEPYVRSTHVTPENEKEEI
jgi:hypothetical protein